MLNLELEQLLNIYKNVIFEDNWLVTIWTNTFMLSPLHPANNNFVNLENATPILLSEITNSIAIILNGEQITTNQPNDLLKITKLLNKVMTQNLPNEILNFKSYKEITSTNFNEKYLAEQNEFFFQGLEKYDKTFITSIWNSPLLISYAQQIAIIKIALMDFPELNKWTTLLSQKLFWPNWEQFIYNERPLQAFTDVELNTITASSELKDLVNERINMFQTCSLFSNQYQPEAIPFVETYMDLKHTQFEIIRNMMTDLLSGDTLATWEWEEKEKLILQALDEIKITFIDQKTFHITAEILKSLENKYGNINPKIINSENLHQCIQNIQTELALRELIVKEESEDLEVLKTEFKKLKKFIWETRLELETVEVLNKITALELAKTIFDCAKTEEELQNFDETFGPTIDLMLEQEKDLLTLWDFLHDQKNFINKKWERNYWIEDFEVNVAELWLDNRRMRDIQELITRMDLKDTVKERLATISSTINTITYVPQHILNKQTDDYMKNSWLCTIWELQVSRLEAAHNTLNYLTRGEKPLMQWPPTSETEIAVALEEYNKFLESSLQKMIIEKKQSLEVLRVWFYQLSSLNEEALEKRLEHVRIALYLDPYIKPPKESNDFNVNEFIILAREIGAYGPLVPRESIESEIYRIAEHAWNLENWIKNKNLKK